MCIFLCNCYFPLASPPPPPPPPFSLSVTYTPLTPSIFPKLSTAMTSLGVIAEEMDKDRRKAFELQGKLDRFKKGATAKGKKVYIPDPCEATEKRVAKLEELYDTAVIDVQVK